MGACADGLLTSLRRHRGGLAGFRRDVGELRAATVRAGRDVDRLQFAGIVLCLIAEDRATLTEIMNSRVVRFYTPLLGADRGVQWLDRGYRHPLGDDWGYARCAAPGRTTATELSAAVDQVPPQAVADLAFFAGTRDQVCETLAAYAAAGLTYASIVDYSGRIDPSLAQNASENVDFLITQL